MTEKKKYPGQLVFGLDIGTRSIVGTVGYKVGDTFYVVSQVSMEHKTRAMLDGQIHDIGKVGATIAEVKSKLEMNIGRKLTEVCIAAAGRVLKTINTHIEMELPEEKEITKEDIYSLDSLGVEKAYSEFAKEGITDEKFYCVGYSIVKYFMNDYPISNLEGHKAKVISADLIATFLPDDVVDGLYKAVELADLSVANLTLEPIAAIQVAIPERYRMLNIALVDVGAGTSDICITKDGSITAYGMIPCAGDALTELIAQHCLVDFATAEQIKRDAGQKDTITYLDIMLLPQTITREEVEKILEPTLTSMAEQVAKKIQELNGGKSVSAVFVIGGGGKFQGYTEKLSEYLEIQKERVALRGEEVMGQITFLEENAVKDSLLVTPIGICMNFYENNNNFIYVTFNNKKIKLYDNGKLTIVDAAMQAEFPNEALFPQRGRALNFTVNGKARIVRGELGEAAVILCNEQTADLHTEIEANDVIVVENSTAGKEASMEILQLPEYDSSLTVIVNGKKVTLPKYASVNGALQSAYYQIQDNDVIEMLNYYTVQQIADFMDIQIDNTMSVYVNNQSAELRTVVYENFSVNFGMKEERREVFEEDFTEDDWAEEDDESVTVDASVIDEDIADETVMEESTKEPAEEVKVQAENTEIVVIINKIPTRLQGKPGYVFVDIFDYINFDLTKQHGKGIVTTVNGRMAQYMEPLYDGDVIEVYWKE